MKQGKVWGSTSPLKQTANAELHLIRVKKGGYCSTHLHKHRWNWFFVITGRLEILVERTDSGTVDTTELTAGQATEVPPGYKHEFEALEDTVALEMYWVEMSGSDIEREKPGGTRVSEVADGG